MLNLIIAAGIFLLLSVICFLFSISKKQMWALYMALFLFFITIIIAGYAAYRYLSVKIDI